MPNHRRPLAAVALVCASAAVLLTGCAIQDRVCSSGQYPVKAVRNTGGDCVPDGQEPVEGWVRYPEGKVPVYVGDEWDRYWDDRFLDENGRIVEGP
ncbi:SCO0607 family lipoprotein [Streptomyces coeruleoprunus]|uniref:SCO0607 family lipoprotein n=1 Tax=Streptomyces coeruleoprunus TaxID=285563 RepID=A0ABV9XMV8_9ACTN